MSGYFYDWLYFLRDTQGAAAIPLIIFGLVLMVLGWRMWRVCVILSFGLIAGLVTLKVTDPSQYAVHYACGAGLVAAVISFKPAKWGIGALGGLIGSGLLLFSLSGYDLSLLTIWGLAGAGLITGAAYSALHREHMVVLVTSFLGAGLFLSGVAAFCLTSPTIASTFRSMSTYSSIVVPFVILVPTVVACFYQISEMRRLGIEF